MERMIVSQSGGFATQLTTSLGRGAEQAAWEMSRACRALNRRFGWWLWWGVIGIVIVASAWWMEHELKLRLHATSARLAKLELSAGPSGTLAAPIQAVDIGNATDGRARMKAFENYLLPHEEIPVAVQEVLHLAESEGLSIQRGEYRPMVEAAGGFLRYYMSLPVKGEAPAIHRFMQAALRSQKNMALESIQFKRERIESQEIEARIQWVVLVRLPGDATAGAKLQKADAESQR